MRNGLATATLIFGITAISAASAADLTGGRSAYVGSYLAGGVRAPQYLVYDNEPGVYVRAYWSAPWQNRRYFPFTGKRPKVGRLERLTDLRPAPQSAETFYREWSTIALYPPTPPVIVRDQANTTPGALK